MSRTDGTNENVLDTGLDSLNDILQSDGFIAGSTIAIKTRPEYPGRLIMYNLAAGRETYYWTSQYVTDSVIENFKEGGGIPESKLHVRQIDDATDVADLTEQIESEAFSEHSNIIIDPINQFEEASDAVYETLLHTLQEEIIDHNCLAVLVCIEDIDRSPPENRWRTLYTADTILDVSREETNSGIRNYLALEKLHPQQELYNEEQSRVFTIPRSLNIDIDTTQRYG